jgi:hypothetical protein
MGGVASGHRLRACQVLDRAGDLICI